MKSKIPYLVRTVNIWLILILMIKIGGYFSIVEERSVNQVFKTVSRVGMTISIFYIFQRLKSYHCIAQFEYRNIYSPLFYLIYLLLGFISISYSTDPKYSSLQWFMVVESFVFVYIFMRVVFIVNYHFPDHKVSLERLFAWSIFPIVIIFIVGSLVAPDVFYREMRGGDEVRLGGWIMNPNELGMLCSIGASMAYLFMQTIKNKFWPILMMVANIWVMFLTSSRSTTIGFFLIMGIMVMMSKNRKLKIVMMSVVAIVAPLTINHIVFKDSGGVEEVMSMTGRLPFWAALLNEGIVKEPFFGYGFMRINYTDYFQGFNTYPGKMTHNTFMQALMNLGFVGLFFVLWQFIFTIGNFFREKKHFYAKAFIAMFIPITINSFTEFGVFGESNYAILFYQYLIFIFVLDIPKKLTPEQNFKLKVFKKRWKNSMDISQIGSN